MKGAISFERAQLRQCCARDFINVARASMKHTDIIQKTHNATYQ
ncbi:MAG: hypothetical protein WC919_03900 [Candidatus Paceibacterota bacterium]